ncbi:hypothetical protein D4764_02G0007690 [Takifugu flavidus]|uniref:Uncharacterized protein n=1 Tax=Takifugu flavidus TaxID=433684 RepID=A0A5C6NM12_9TELE|nr:hypothetical protein D4764_02G0007690 [Takifugu flavidus]
MPSVKGQKFEQKKKEKPGGQKHSPAKWPGATDKRK